MINSFFQRGGGAKVKKWQKGIENENRKSTRGEETRWLGLQDAAINQTACFVPPSLLPEEDATTLPLTTPRFVRRNDRGKQLSQSRGEYLIDLEIPSSNRRLELNTEQQKRHLFAITRFISILFFKYILFYCYFRSVHFTIKLFLNKTFSSMRKLSISTLFFTCFLLFFSAHFFRHPRKDRSR